MGAKREDLRRVALEKKKMGKPVEKIKGEWNQKMKGQEN